MQQAQGLEEWKFYPFALNTFGGFVRQIGTFLYEFFTDAFSAKRDAAEKAGEPEWKVILEKKSLYMSGSLLARIISPCRHFAPGARCGSSGTSTLRVRTIDAPCCTARDRGKTGERHLLLVDRPT